MLKVVAGGGYCVILPVPGQIATSLLVPSSCSCKPCRQALAAAQGRLPGQRRWQAALTAQPALATSHQVYDALLDQTSLVSRALLHTVCLCLSCNKSSVTWHGGASKTGLQPGAAVCVNSKQNSVHDDEHSLGLFFSKNWQSCWATAQIAAVSTSAQVSPWRADHS